MSDSGRLVRPLDGSPPVCATLERFPRLAGPRRSYRNVRCRPTRTIVPRRVSMRKVVASTFLSLDGVMQAPGGPEEDPAGGFTFGGWVFHYWDEMGGGIMDEVMRKPFDLLLGRKTYDIFAAYWPYIGN